MDEQKEPTEPQIFEGMFFSLAISISTAAMSQMGKLANPITGKVERNLAQAKSSIDMLRMLKAKTAGNLGEREQQFLDKTVSELQMNYLEEVRKGDAPPQEAESSSAKATADKSAKAKEEAKPKAEKKEAAAPAKAAAKLEKPAAKSKAAKKKVAKKKGKPK